MKTVIKWAARVYIAGFVAMAIWLLCLVPPLAWATLGFWACVGFVVALEEC